MHKIIRFFFGLIVFIILISSIINIFEIVKKKKELIKVENFLYREWSKLGHHEDKLTDLIKGNKSYKEYESRYEKEIAKLFARFLILFIFYSLGSRQIHDY